MSKGKKKNIAEPNEARALIIRVLVGFVTGMVSMLLRLSAISELITIRFCNRCFTSRSLLRSFCCCVFICFFICARWLRSPDIDVVCFLAALFFVVRVVCAFFPAVPFLVCAPHGAMARASVNSKTLT